MYRMTLTMMALCQIGGLPVKADDSPIAARLAQADPRQAQADRLLEQGTQQYRIGQPTQAIVTLQ